MNEREESTAIVKTEEALKRIDDVIGKCSLTIASAKGSLRESLAISQGIRALEKLITDEMMEDLVALRDTRLGFLTDEASRIRGGKPAYSKEQIRRFLIEAFLRGYRVVNNEVNLIGGNLYVAKNGITRQLKELEGFSGYQENYEYVSLNEDWARIKCQASWKMKSRPMAMGMAENDPCIIPIKVNKGMGLDAVIGKAQRKFRAKIIERITGSEVPEGEIEDAKNANAEVIEPSERQKKIHEQIKLLKEDIKNNHNEHEENNISPEEPEKVATDESIKINGTISEYLGPFNKPLLDDGVYTMLLSGKYLQISDILLNEGWIQGIQKGYGKKLVLESQTGISIKEWIKKISEFADQETGLPLLLSGIISMSVIETKTENEIFNTGKK